MSTVRVDRKLNLVFTIEGGDAGTIYVHSTPISRVIFEQFYLPLSKTFSRMYTQGLSFIAGPRIAGMMLKNVAEEMGAWSGPDGVENGLMNEVRRLTNVVMAGANGWDTIPYEQAKNSGMLTEDEISEVEGAIVFFTVNSAMHLRKNLEAILAGMNDLWGTSTTYSNVTAFRESLPTLTTTADTTKRVTQSSLPS